MQGPTRSSNEPRMVPKLGRGENPHSEGVPRDCIDQRRPSKSLSIPFRMIAMYLNPWNVLLIAIAGWMNREQVAVIEYLKEENRVLHKFLGKKRPRQCHLSVENRPVIIEMSAPPTPKSFLGPKPLHAQPEGGRGNPMAERPSSFLLPLLFGDRPPGADIADGLAVDAPHPRPGRRARWDAGG